FARRAAAQAGAAMLELPWVWFRADEALTKVSATGAELIHAAQQAGRAILYLTPHVGCFEIAARFGARLGPITVLYRPPRQQLLRPLIENARAAGLQTAPATLKGVRQLVRALRRSEQVGILPDQVPGKGEGA